MTVKNTREPAFDPKAFLATQARGRTVSHYQDGNIVFSQGDEADAVYYVRRGRVKISVTSTQGKEAVIAIVGVGEFFGEGCLIGQPLRLATASALGECALMRLDTGTMLSALHDQPELAEVFTSHLLLRNSRIEEDLIDQLFNSSEKRLARALLLLANFEANGTPQPITAKISQAMLAKMVGTTRSRISFFMNRFRKLGFIDYNGSLVVHRALLSVLLRD